MTWVVVDDPLPAGSTALGRGLGGDSTLATQGERKQGTVWPAFEERTFTAYRAYFRYVPKGRFIVEYTVRLNNPGAFNLPATRVEAMYAPEMFGEVPNAGVGGAAMTPLRWLLRYGLRHRRAGRRPTCGSGRAAGVRRRQGRRTFRPKRCSLDRHGVPLAEIRVECERAAARLGDVERRLARIERRAVAAEDKRFYEHDGVDWPGMAVAAWDSLWRSADGRRPRGGSTLTMQLAGLLDPSAASRRRRSAHAGAEVGPGGGRARAGAHVEQGADPRGLPQSVVVSRRAQGPARRDAGPVRQGAGGGGRPRSGDSRRAAARPRRQAGARRATRVHRRRRGHAGRGVRADPRAGFGGAGRRLPAAAAVEPGAASRREDAQGAGRAA